MVTVVAFRSINRAAQAATEVSRRRGALPAAPLPVWPDREAVTADSGIAAICVVAFSVRKSPIFFATRATNPARSAREPRAARMARSRALMRRILPRAESAAGRFALGRSRRLSGLLPGVIESAPQ